MTETETENVEITSVHFMALSRFFLQKGKEQAFRTYANANIATKLFCNLISSHKRH
jgi:hypothetical protein